MRRQFLVPSLAITLSLGLAGCSSSDNGSSKGSVKYLGLGDSIAYGENGFVPYTVAARPNGAAFVGYPDLIGAQDFGGHYANLGCPGATTDSYLSLDGIDNGCRDFQKDWLNTMHVQYVTAEADEADEELTMNDVRVVTLSIGGNDLLLTLADCAKQNPDDANGTLACALKEVPNTLAKGASNLGKIIQRIQDAGFKGQFIYVNLYSTYLPTDSATLAVGAWNNAMAPVVMNAGGSVADAFTAFADAANAAGGDPCAAGLLIPNPDSSAMPPCDIHPSAQGARLLADTIQATPGYAP